MTEQAPFNRWRHYGGWARLPQSWWRLQKFHDAWLCLTGQMSLHTAWQRGLDEGQRMEYQRTVVNGGR